MTSAADKHVKLWSLEGQLWGDINLLREGGDKQWTYPFDWTEKREQDVARVQKLMALVDPPQPGVEERARFEQRQQKERDQRETIDYLAKRQRRMDFEEYLRRIERQKAEALGREQALYVSAPARQAEAADLERYRADLRRMAGANFASHLTRTPLLQAMDDRFEGLIDAALKGDDLREVVQEAIDNFGRPDPASQQRSTKQTARP